MSLSCEQHTAAIYDRGARQRLGVITPLTSVRWQRVRDDMSSATIFTSQPTWECLKLLENVSVNRHELVIFRGKERVWEGPISRIAYSASAVEIEARDVLYYAYRTVMHHEHSNAYPNVTSVVERALSILETELDRKELLTPPINVLPYVQTYIGANPARTAKVTPPYQKYVYEEIDELAARSGLDYTVIGRSIILMDRHVEFSRTPTVTEADFLGEVIVTEYGMEGGTIAFVTDGQGRFGVAGIAVDPYYGEWELLDTAYQETDGPNVVPPTDSELASQAQRNISGRNPPPTTVRIPDGSQLNPNGVLSMSHLVPGIRVPLVATLTARTFSQMQKLDLVTVTETAEGGETITITLSPASTDDVPPEEDN